MIKLQTLKGFRDFLPKEAKKRQYVINAFKWVCKSYGFEPLETPALEYEEVLLGKYGEEGDKLMYRFTDNGGRKVAMRYDQTVPLSRVVAQYQNQLPLPFKRYQIQPVWRAENTQKGRFREFLQCDADVVGTKSVLADAEVIAVAARCLKNLGFKDFKILINDRKVFSDIPKNTISSIDKLKKIGKEKVIDELIETGLSTEQATNILKEVEDTKPTQWIEELFANLKSLGVSKFEFSPTLARGLDYYTSTIFEIEIDGYTAGSVCGGGRYDKLIGLLSGKDVPAVGFAFGFDRVLDAMEQFELFPKDLGSITALVTIFSPDLKEKSIELVSALRAENIDAELYLDENAKMDKQLKYADQKGILYALIIGPEEVEKNMITLKDLKTREQKTVTLDVILNKFADLCRC